MKKLYSLVSVMSLLLILSACGSTTELKQVNDEEAVKILDSKKVFSFIFMTMKILKNIKCTYKTLLTRPVPL